jgi:hypothetical protein
VVYDRVTYLQGDVMNIDSFTAIINLVTAVLLLGAIITPFIVGFWKRKDTTARSFFISYALLGLAIASAVGAYIAMVWHAYQVATLLQFLYLIVFCWNFIRQTWPTTRVDIALFVLGIICAIYALANISSRMLLQEFGANLQKMQPK